MIQYQEFIPYIQEHRTDDVRELALKDRKRLGDAMPFVLDQINGWQKARTKIPTWTEIEGILYPVQLSMEQCSSERTALYKASLVEGGSFVDLTGGFGVDFSFIARNFKRATMVERREELCEIARHNMPLLGVPHAEVVNGDGIEYLKGMEPVDLILIDPARRDQQGKKTVSIADCEPNLLEILETLRSKAKRVLIKYSPMLDISLAIKELGTVSQTHIVSVDNECKELLFLLDSQSKGSPIVHTCVNLGKNGQNTFTFTMEEEKNNAASLAKSIGAYLYEPNSSIMKAGAFKCLTKRFPVDKIETNSHLYTSDCVIEEFPGRSFRIIKSFGMGKKEMKEGLQNIEKANIAVRNFPMDVNALRQKLRLKEGGESYLFATTHNGAHLIILCEKIYKND